MRFGDACSDSPNSNLRNQFDADASVMVCVFEIVDQLSEIFDGINIVMWGRGDETDARGRVADLGDPWINFSSRQLPALARLGPLGHFDLQFLGLNKIKAGDAE